MKRLSQEELRVFADWFAAFRAEHGQRTGICAGCRKPIGAAEALDLADGNRVHLNTDYDCLIRYGNRRHDAAT